MSKPVFADLPQTGCQIHLQGSHANDFFSDAVEQPASAHCPDRRERVSVNVSTPCAAYEKCSVLGSPCIHFVGTTRNTARVVGIRTSGGRTVRELVDTHGTHHFVDVTHAPPPPPVPAGALYEQAAWGSLASPPSSSPPFGPVGGCAGLSSPSLLNGATWTSMFGGPLLLPPLDAPWAHPLYASLVLEHLRLFAPPPPLPPYMPPEPAPTSVGA